MLTAVKNAAKEAKQAAAVAGDQASALRLGFDFTLSRLLRWRMMPGRNSIREANVDGLHVHYRFNRGDLQSIREVLLEECYTLPFSCSPKTILDLGANIGLASLWMWREFRPEKIIAVECDPDNARMTRSNYASNHLAGEVVEAAVGAVTGTGTFLTDRASNLGRLEVTGAPAPDQQKGALVVNTITLAELIRRFEGSRVDLIKMDIEGAEAAVFSGNLDWLQSVGAMIIEMHDDRVDVPAIIHRIVEAGFESIPANIHRQDNLIAFRKRPHQPNAP